MANVVLSNTVTRNTAKSIRKLGLTYTQMTPGRPKSGPWYQCGFVGCPLFCPLPSDRLHKLPLIFCE